MAASESEVCVRACGDSVTGALSASGERSLFHSYALVHCGFNVIDPATWQVNPLETVRFVELRSNDC